MSFLPLLQKVVIGVPTGIAAVTVLPVFGAAGAITAAGLVVGSAVSAAAAAVTDSSKD